MPDSDIGDWFRSIPIITRWWFGLSIVFPLLGRIGLLNPYYMILDFSLVAYKFQIWRLFTSIVYFPLSPNTGFHYLINLYFLYNYSTRLESGVFDGRPADYLFLLIFNTISLIFLGFAMKLMLLMDALILSVLYIWCQINKDQIVQFWFGTQFKAMYLPWVLAAFNMILGQGGVMEITGIFVGHLYFFLMFKYPQDFGGRRLLSTPSILSVFLTVKLREPFTFFSLVITMPVFVERKRKRYNYLPNRRGGVSGFGQAPQARRQPDGRGGFPGGGQRLGDN